MAKTQAKRKQTYTTPQAAMYSQSLAMADGWLLAEDDRDGTMIQRYDLDGRFAGDDEAFEHVKRFADMGGVNELAALRAIEAAQQRAERATEPVMIDFTPPGLKTADGSARVTLALKEWDDATAKVANLAGQMVNDGVSADDWLELKGLVQARSAKQEQFLKAVAGE